MNNIEKSLAQINQLIQRTEKNFNRPPGSVQLIAVSKTKPVESIRTAIVCQQADFAENYVQEAIDKMASIGHVGLTWHFIGPVQSNKTRPIAAHFDWVHSIDRIKIAKRLNDMRPRQKPPLNICIQVNTSAEETKFGIDPDQLTDIAQYCASLPQIRLRGLMALPAPCSDFEQQRLPFRRLREMFIELQSFVPTIDTLSMGTSQDMEAAIAEGSTMVRIGSAIFGPRNT